MEHLTDDKALWVEDPTQELRLMTLYSFEWADITPVGLSVKSRGFEWEQFEEDVNVLLTMETASQWAIGDAYNAGIMRFRGKDPTQVFTARQVKYKTIQNYAWVCGKFPLNERWYPPSFSHHSIIAKLGSGRRQHWLRECVQQDLSCEDLDVMTAVERGVTLYEQRPFDLMVDYYNKSLQAWQRLPTDWPERALLGRALKLMETAIHKVEKRNGNQEL